MTPHPQEHLLPDVLSLVDIPQHLGHCTHHAILMPQDEFPESRFVTTPDKPHQPVIRGIVVIAGPMLLIHRISRPSVMHAGLHPR
jgi:hypothetical protein